MDVAPFVQKCYLPLVLSEHEEGAHHGEMRGSFINGAIMCSLTCACVPSSLHHTARQKTVYCNNAIINDLYVVS